MNYLFAKYIKDLNGLNHLDINNIDNLVGKIVVNPECLTIKYKNDNVRLTNNDSFDIKVVKGPLLSNKVEGILKKENFYLYVNDKVINAFIRKDNSIYLLFVSDKKCNNKIFSDFDDRYIVDILLYNKNINYNDDLLFLKLINDNIYPDEMGLIEYKDRDFESIYSVAFDIFHRTDFYTSANRNRLVNDYKLERVLNYK